MTPASVDPFSYLLRSSINKRLTLARAYTAARWNAISFKVSVALFVVSSNPGVSTRVTVLPSRVNSSATWTSAVHDINPIPVRRFEPLARLINWRQPGEFPVIFGKCILLTAVLPLPVAPMTLWQRSGNISTGEWAVRYARNLDGWSRGRPILACTLLNVFAKLIAVGYVLGSVPPSSLWIWEVLTERMLPGDWRSPQVSINRALSCAASRNRPNMYLGTTAGGFSGPGWRRGQSWSSCSFGVSDGTPGSYPHSCSAIGIMDMGFDNCSRTHAHH